MENLNEKNQNSKKNPRKIRIADEVYLIIKERVNSSEWKPGDRINDEELAKTLSVSRLSVRTALDRLVQDDVLEQRQWKGYFLRKISKEEVVHLTEVRLALEELAINNICKLPDEKLIYYITSMTILINKAEKLLKEGDHVGFMATGFEFHETIHTASQNPIIPQLIGNVIMKINIMRNISMGREEEEFIEVGKCAISDHRKILEAISQRNSSLACSLMRIHLSQTFINNTCHGLDY